MIPKKIILEDLWHHFNDKIRPEQSGFESDHSTTRQLVNLIDNISVKTNNREHTGFSVNWYQKGIRSCLTHRTHLQNVHLMNLPFHLFKLVDSSLFNRTFSVKVEDGLSSSSRNIHAGVSQGTCLAPTLNLIYINDMPTHVNASLSLYADDTMFFTKTEKSHLP